MNIVMVGDQAVGKTTFMTLTYGMMSDSEIGGFKIRCRDRRIHDKLEAAYRAFRTDGSYPDPTSKMDEYNYAFYSDQQWVMNFTLTDIRGEGIHDYDLDELAEQLRKADAMMLFLNGYEIMQGVDVSEQIDDIYTLIGSCFVTEGKDQLIMVIFTQVDRLEEFDENVMNQLNDTVRELKQMADASEHIRYLAVPTACSMECMMDLDFVMVTLMLFGYMNDVETRYQKIIDERDSILEEYGSGLLREVLDFFGLDSKRKKARDRAMELEKEIDEYNKMCEKFERLRKFVDEYKIGKFYRIRHRWSSRSEDPFDL